MVSQEAAMRPWSPVLICLLPLTLGCPSPDKPEVEDSGETLDADGDGYGEGRDCDDDDPDVHPGAAERCNGIDDDCDGFVDDADADLSDGESFWPDADGDGWGDEGQAIQACEQPEGHLEEGGDCDDADASVHPDKLEECNGIDDDCDGEVDEDGALWADDWYQDSDGDGYGDPAVSRESCDQPEGWVDNDDDCDDTQAGAYPGAPETAAGVDDDCDGLVDEWQVGDAWAVVQGESAGDRAGRALAGAGDQDWDGLVDWWAGARGDDDGGSDAGAVYLVNSDDGGQRSLANASVKLTGRRGSMAGHALDGGRDVDGDGRADLIVGGPYDDDAAPNAGVAWLLTGPLEDGPLDQGVVLVGNYDSDLAGWSVALVGDVEGEGLGAIAVGAPYAKDGASSPGVAYLLLEPPSEDLVLQDSALRLVGEGNQHGAGIRVAAAGDLDGDGLDDLLVGAHAAGFGGFESGAAYLWLASSLAGLDGSVDLGDADGRHHGESAYDMAGYGLAGGGDLDGDGLADLIVGAPYHDEAGADAGAAYLLTGPATSFASLADAPVKLMGARAGDSAGNGVAISPDVDGDGLAEALVGSPVYREGAEGLAALWIGVEPGRHDLAEAPRLFQGAVDGDYTGFAVAGPGDMDGDGLGDLLVGQSLDATMGSEAGAICVLFGVW
jgi:hypothetical protein